jgi:hypothetical protein
VELQLLIANALIELGGTVALFEWSRTCSSYRNILAPYIFRSVILDNTEEGASKLLAFVENKRGCLVESLVLRTTFPDRSDDIDVVTQIANTLPAGVYKLLADLQQFPRLRVLTIDLPLTFHALLSCEENMDRIDNPGSWDWWKHLH